MPVSLKSKTARAALAPRREPYWYCVRVGLYLGYRRTAEGDGTWIGRQLEPGSKKYLLRSFGCLPDYESGLRELQTWATGVDLGASHKATSLEDACRAYVTHQRTHKTQANGADAEGRFGRPVYGKPIGATNRDKLRSTHVTAWRNAQLDEDGGEDDLRRSRDSANRNLTTLKAALNWALENRLVATDAGWKTVTRFPNAGRRRERFLGQDERAALIGACAPDLAALATVLLLTGARPGEIAACNVSDIDRKRGTLALSGKTGQRTVTLSSAATAFLKEQVSARLPSAPLLADAFGNRWNKDAWQKRIKTAAKVAGLADDVVLYTLRHVAISEMIAGGGDTFLVTKLAGTSTAMIDTHYGHLRHTQTRARLDAVSIV